MEILSGGCAQGKSSHKPKPKHMASKIIHQRGRIVHAEVGGGVIRGERETTWERQSDKLGEEAGVIILHLSFLPSHFISRQTLLSPSLCSRFPFSQVIICPLVSAGWAANHSIQTLMPGGRGASCMHRRSMGERN